MLMLKSLVAIRHAHAQKFGCYTSCSCAKVWLLYVMLMRKSLVAIRHAHAQKFGCYTSCSCAIMATKIRILMKKNTITNRWSYKRNPEEKKIRATMDSSGFNIWNRCYTLFNTILSRSLIWLNLYKTHTIFSNSIGSGTWEY